MASRPALSSISPGSARISPGIMALASWDRIVNGHQLGAIGEGRLDLDFRDHLWHPIHHVLTLQDGSAVPHELGDCLAVAGALKDRGSNKGDRLGIIELQAPRLAPFG